MLHMRPGNVLEGIKGGEQVLAIEVVIFRNEQHLGLASAALHRALLPRAHAYRQLRRPFHPRLGLYGQRQDSGGSSKAAKKGAAREFAFAGFVLSVAAIENTHRVLLGMVIFVLVESNCEPAHARMQPPRGMKSYKEKPRHARARRGSFRLWRDGYSAAS